MIYPTKDAYYFTEWLINVSWQKLSAPQLLIVQAINTAAANGSSVSAQTWQNFNLFTAWRYPFFEVYQKMQSTVSTSLLSKCVASWSFEGNANDETGTYNGTAVNVLYDAAYGKIGQGAWFNGTNSMITIPGLSTGGNFSFFCWIYPLVSATNPQMLFTNATGIEGLRYNPASQIITFRQSGEFNTVGLAPLNQWSFVGCTLVGTVLQMFVNAKAVSGLITTASSFTVIRLGAHTSGNRFQGYMDSASFFNQALTYDEIAQLYNNGNGVQYPF